MAFDFGSLRNPGPRHGIPLCESLAQSPSPDAPTPPCRTDIREVLDAGYPAPHYEHTETGQRLEVGQVYDSKEVGEVVVVAVATCAMTSEVAVIHRTTDGKVWSAPVAAFLAGGKHGYPNFILKPKSEEWAVSGQGCAVTPLGDSARLEERVAALEQALVSIIGAKEKK